MEISTLECPNLTTERVDGNSTRQIDFAIQKMFQGYSVKLEDHYTVIEEKCSTSVRKRFSEFLLRKLIRRIEIEHRRYKVVYTENYNKEDFYYVVRLEKL